MKNIKCTLINKNRKLCMENSDYTNNLNIIGLTCSEIGNYIYIYSDESIIWVVDVFDQSKNSDIHSMFLR